MKELRKGKGRGATYPYFHRDLDALVTLRQQPFSNPYTPLGRRRGVIVTMGALRHVVPGWRSAGPGISEDVIVYSITPSSTPGRKDEIGWDHLYVLDKHPDRYGPISDYTGHRQ